MRIAVLTGSPVGCRSGVNRKSGIEKSPNHRATKMLVARTCSQCGEGYQCQECGYECDQYGACLRESCGTNTGEHR